MKKLLLLLSITTIIFTYFSCSKSHDGPPADPCAGVTIALTATIVNTNTGQSTGSLTVNATGSTGLTYTLNGGTPQPNGFFSNLPAGTYTVAAKNTNGCTGSAQFVVGTNPPANPCTGVTITLTGTVTNASTGNSDGSITVVAAGSTGFTYSINNGTFQSAAVFNGLAAGVYTVIAKNAAGCTGTAQFTVGTTNPCTGVTITVTGTVTNATTANNGSIVAAASPVATYTFSINGGTTFQATGTFNNLAPGSYTIIAKNIAGCTGTNTFTVANANPCTTTTITVTTTTTNVTPCVTPVNGGITVSASGGTGPYTYSLDGVTFQSSNNFSGLAANNYTVTAKDANGCTKTATVTVVTAAPGALFNAVKQVLATNCAISGCHAGPSPQNGLDFTDNCTIANNNSRIKARAVDANPSIMPPPPNPPLSAADKQKIVDWVNAGGQVNN